MKLNNLKPAPGTTKNPKKRLGRGQGSGKGGTSTRGNKGAKARSGYEHKIGFEGGQMPLQRRVPKTGFHNPTRVEYQPVNVSALQKLAEEKKLSAITLEDLQDAGLAKPSDLVKILGNGEISVKVDVTADAFSKSAVSKIEAAGGKAIIAED
jgi:large subunit ribosomal protein L15